MRRTSGAASSTANPTEEMIPGFEDSAPLERPIIEQRYLMLTEDALLGATYRSMQFAEPPVQRLLGAALPVRPVARRDRPRQPAPRSTPSSRSPICSGKTAGSSASRPASRTASCWANVVVLADGANSLLAQKAGLHQEWDPIDQALVAKELIRLAGVEKIEDRFNLPQGMGTALEIFGESTWGLLGYGFIYTNKESLSIGTGALLSDLIETGRNVNDMLDRFKRHPAIAPLLAGRRDDRVRGPPDPRGRLQPTCPSSYADGVVVVGDAAGFVNPLNREGVNLAMLSGKLAAQAIVEAHGPRRLFGRVALALPGVARRQRDHGGSVQDPERDAVRPRPAAPVPRLPRTGVRDRPRVPDGRWRVEEGEAAQNSGHRPGCAQAPASRRPCRGRAVVDISGI